MKKALTLSLALCLTLTQANAAPLLSLIEAGGGLNSKAAPVTEPYRAMPFVELRDVGGREREYSVPFITDLNVQKIVADYKNNWTTYQDTVWWNRQAALNSGLFSMTFGFNNGMWCSYMPDPSELTKPKPDEVDITPNTDPQANVGSQLNYNFNWQPLVPTAKACQNVNPTWTPDETFPFGWGSVYTPAVLNVWPNGAWTDVGGNPWPIPAYFDWEQVMARTDQTCTTTSQSELKNYLLNSEKSLRLYAPLAIDWDGTLGWTSAGGTRSGTTMAPFFSTKPEHLQKYAQSVLDISQQDAQFAQYFAGGLPNPLVMAEHAKDLQANNTRPGLSKFENMKLGLFPGTLNDQEKHGYATFFQTWQNIDTVFETRPSIYTATAYIIYWVPTIFFGIPAPSTPIPIPVTLPAPHQVITPAGCTHVPNPYAIGPGTSNYAVPRYHWGQTNVIEGYDVPNTFGTPIRIGTEE